MTSKVGKKSPRKFNSLIEAQEFRVPEKTRRIDPKKKKIGVNSAGKLSKNDPDYYSKIGKISAEKRIRKLGTSYFSDMAKKSHPRSEYHGGRPPKKPVVESPHGDLADSGTDLRGTPPPA